ncbi:MAG: hypothetical protein IKL47_10780 [Clostridia bacterium]|nr:hypothetical protein [Clostridia bacterium]
MSGKLFRRILIIILSLCILLSTAHVAYVVFAYQNSSIIYFISKELW